MAAVVVPPGARSIAMMRACLVSGRPADFVDRARGLTLAAGANVDPNIIDKVVKTICAIANIGPKSSGKLLIGITDKKADADRAKTIDSVEPKKIGKRFVVGVNREAKRMGITTEQYFSKWKEGIKKSELTPELKDAVLSNIDFNSFYGLGVIAITVPQQAALSYVGEDLYWRNGDSTELAKTAKEIAGLASRFAKG
jgi:predicted HTH transcriptional regulator